MSVWSDKSLRLRGAEVFEPFDLTKIQPASYDMVLGDDFLIQAADADIYYDLQTRRYINKETGQTVEPWMNIKASKRHPFILKPNEFALGTTLEKVKIPRDTMARFEGKSSLGRIGLIVHVTAGYVDPGFEGQITLEFKNISKYDIQLVPGVPIGQLSLHWMDAPVEKKYGECGNHYQGQVGATAPK